MRVHLSLGAALASLTALAACADAPPAAEVAVADPAEPARLARTPLPDDETPYFVLGSGPGPRVRPPRPTDSAAFAAYMERGMDEARRAFDLSARVGAAADWRAADRIVREAAETDSVLAQSMALAVLRHHLIRGDLDADKAEALGRYTQALLDQDSREGAVLLWALRRLAGHWDAARIRGAALRAADDLGAAYARLARCVDCTVEEAVGAMLPRQRRAAEARLREMAVVHAELIRMSEPEQAMP